MATLIDKLEEYLEAQPSAHVKLNQAMRWLRAMVPQPSIVDRDVEDPSTIEPSDGDLYLVGAAPVGDWTDQSGAFALYYSDGWGTNGWDFLDPTEGMTMWVRDEDAHLKFDGTSWSAV